MLCIPVPVSELVLYGKETTTKTIIYRDAEVQSRTLVRTLNPRTEPKVQVQFSSGSPSCVQVQFRVLEL